MCVNIFNTLGNGQKWSTLRQHKPTQNYYICTAQNIIKGVCILGLTFWYPAWMSQLKRCWSIERVRGILFLFRFSKKLTHSTHSQIGGFLIIVKSIHFCGYSAHQRESKVCLKIRAVWRFRKMSLVGFKRRNHSTSALETQGEK